MKIIGFFLAGRLRGLSACGRSNCTVGLEMKTLALALLMLSFTSCKHEDRFVDRGPGGFTKEEFQIDLSSIPHAAVRYFNGVVLVLDLDREDVGLLKSDGRFQWAKPDYEGSYRLGDELFIEGDKFEIVACQWEEPNAASGWDWKMIAIDSTRGRLFAAVDAWPHFEDFGTPKPKQKGTNQPTTAPQARPETNGKAKPEPEGGSR